MATKGLGKGLGALISMFDEQNEEVQTLSKTVSSITARQGQAEHTRPAEPESFPKGVTEIDVTLIDNNVNQPRRDFDIEKLQELADSIKSNGVIQPILLNKVGTRYMIIAGERRWRAAKLAGLKTIPSVVRVLTPAQIAEVAIVENLQRQDLNEVELARGIKKLMDDFHLTQDQVAIRIGKNRSSVANTLRVLSLPPEVITMIENNTLTAGHAKCLAALQNKELILKLARRCAAEHLSVRALEKLIQEIHDVRKPGIAAAMKSSFQSLELKDFEKRLNNKFATKVVIQGSDRQGKIIIEYYNSDDLNRIRKIFNG